MGRDEIAIVLVEAERYFLDLLQRFPPREYPVVFAPSLQIAAERLGQQPKLLVVPLSDEDRASRESLIADAKAKGVKVLGISDAESDPLAQTVDAVAADDADAVLEAAGRLLQERRSAPRAAVSVPVNLGKIGDLEATVISGRSLFVPTDNPMSSGRMVQVTINAGAATLRCWANVLRVQGGRAGAEEGEEAGMVLGIPEREKSIRAYLEGLVRGAMLIEHVDSGGATPPEGIDRQLATRVQREIAALRETLQSQTTLTDALNDRIDKMVADEARAVKWKDVRPALARKLSAQAEMVHSLLQRVDDLTAGESDGQGGATTGLRDALETQRELLQRAEAQQDLIDELRARLDAVNESNSEQRDLQGTVSRQAQLLALLASRIDQLEHGGLHGAVTLQAQPQQHQRLEQLATKLAQLSIQFEKLQDQVRLGVASPDRIAELNATVDDSQKAIQQQLGHAWADDEPTRPGTVVDPIFAPNDAAATQAEQELYHDESTADFPQEMSAALIAAEPRVAEDAFLEEPATVKQALPAVVSQPSSASDEAPLVAPQRKMDGVLLPSLDAVEQFDSGPAAAEEVSAAPVLPPDSHISSTEDPIPRRIPRWLLIGTVCVVVSVLGLVLFFWLVGDKQRMPIDNKIVRDQPDHAVAPPAADASPDISDASPEVSTAAPDLTPDVAQSKDAAAVDSAAADAPSQIKVSPRRRYSAAARRRIRRRALIRVARRLLRKGKETKARPYLTKALKMSDDYLVRWLLARSHERSGENWAAIYHLSKAVAKASASLKPARQDHLGVLYSKVGKKAKACAQFRSALKQRPDFKPALKHLQRHCGGR